MNSPPFNSPGVPSRDEPELPQDLDSLINNLSSDSNDI